MGRRYAATVGAPFLFRLSAARPDDGKPREGSIWYPFHGWEGQHIAGDHQRLIDEILETEDGPVTFCLYWHPVFADLGYRRGLCPVAEAFYAEQLSLPLFPGLSDTDQDRVVETLRGILGS